MIRPASRALICSDNGLRDQMVETVVVYDHQTAVAELISLRRGNMDLLDLLAMHEVIGDIVVADGFRPLIVLQDDLFDFRTFCFCRGFFVGNPGMVTIARRLLGVERSCAFADAAVELGSSGDGRWACFYRVASFIGAAAVGWFSPGCCDDARLLHARLTLGFFRLCGGGQSRLHELIAQTTRHVTGDLKRLRFGARVKLAWLLRGFGRIPYFMPDRMWRADVRSRRCVAQSAPDRRCVSDATTARPIPGRCRRSGTAVIAHPREFGDGLVVVTGNDEHTVARGAGWLIRPADAAIPTSAGLLDQCVSGCAQFRKPFRELSREGLLDDDLDAFAGFHSVTPG